MVCPVERIPQGWRVWRGPVSPELTRFAVRELHAGLHPGPFPYGEILAIEPGSVPEVGAWASHHTWTYRDGKLVQGICIPGVSLLKRPVAGFPSEGEDSLDAPDPTAQVYTEAPAITGEQIVAIGGAAAVILALGFGVVRRWSRARARKEAFAKMIADAPPPFPSRGA